MATDRQHDALKQVAGLIQKLSYRDMQTLSEKIAGHFTDKRDSVELAKVLLRVSDDILAVETKPAIVEPFKNYRR